MNILRVPKYKQYKKLEEKIVKGPIIKKEDNVLKNGIKWLVWHGFPRENIKIGNNSFSSSYQKIDDLILGKDVDKKNVYVRISDDKASIEVDIDNDVDLSNMKISKIPSIIKFKHVNGNFNIALNYLEDMSNLPEEITGQLNISMNNIKNFNNSSVKKVGVLSAKQQRVKTDYPLTEENYKLFLDGRLSENVVFAGPCKKCGVLTKIDEKEGIAYIKFKDNKTAHRYSLDEVFPMHGVTLMKELLN